MDPKTLKMAKIEIEVEAVEMPKNWKTAKEMRNNSMSYQNESLCELVNNLMGFIQETSDKGGLRGSYKVRGGRYTEVYQRAQEILTSLGYEVEGSVLENETNRWWTISW